MITQNQSMYQWNMAITAGTNSVAVWKVESQQTILAKMTPPNLSTPYICPFQQKKTQYQPSCYYQVIPNTSIDEWAAGEEGYLCQSH